MGIRIVSIENKWWKSPKELKIVLELEYNDGSKETYVGVVKEFNFQREFLKELLKIKGE
jgi:hypothetical protein